MKNKNNFVLQDCRDFVIILELKFVIITNYRNYLWLIAFINNLEKLRKKKTVMEDKTSIIFRGNQWETLYKKAPAFKQKKSSFHQIVWT